ncbi:MAG: alpha-glucan family phosphorylase [Myxococcales bacterium]|nr:alpha-glucan family phosphorylase [Myxococcales bacterium]
MRSRLLALCENLWWCWDSQATELFASLHPERWEEVHHNPIMLLDELEDAALEKLPPRVMGRLESVEQRLAAYLAGNDTWASREMADFKGNICYFSMEFAIHESLPIYSGGLGVLAGDHLKSASDLGLPLIGIGLLYREGYFKQVIANNRQVPAWPATPLEQTPLRRLDVFVEVPHGHHTYRAQVWALKVGRVQLYLLDSDVEGNRPEHRNLSMQLYGGDSATRIQQEVLLGVGGVRALRALGVEPTVIHMNEGHAAFAVVERWREELLAGHRVEKAWQRVRAGCVFTTHTPVDAGHDRFNWDLKQEALEGLRESMKLPEGAIMDLGRIEKGNVNEPLCMTVLALRGSRSANGVAKLHGEVSRKMWQNLYPSLAEADVPIGSVTNGVHAPSWMSGKVQRLLDEASPRWREGADISLDAVPDEKLWEMRCSLRLNLVAWANRELGRDWLDPDALTIGFARRFAPYKRGNLIFSDPDRLEAILTRSPVQILFAGKAHPRDAAGQGILRDVLEWTRDERFRGRVVFLPDYDMALGRRLTQGVDVWLNTPRRPREASGTSGMKVPLNLGINCSILDGWWPEAFDGTNGWAIGDGGERPTVEEQDAVDAASLYEVLENHVVPEFYDRADGTVPTAWVRRMRRSLETCTQQFHTSRMVAEYARKYYTTS